MDTSRIHDVQEIAGHGVRAIIDGKNRACRKCKAHGKEKIKYTVCNSIGTVVYLALDGKFAGYIVIEDQIKEDAPAAIKQLKEGGIRQTRHAYR